MKSQKSLNSLMALFLGIVILVQSFGVVPVFAAGTDFHYILTYNEGDHIDADHPVIIPDSDVDPDYGADVHYLFSSFNEGITGTTGSVIPQWGDEPYRIIGYTFGGWYTEANGMGIKVDEDTIITDDMLSGGMLELYGHWIEYDSPDVISDSLTISAKNEKEEYLSDVVITDTDGNTGISSDKTEYYAEVYGDTHYLTLEFEQYEPDAVTSVTFNGADVAFDEDKKEIFTATGYVWQDTSDGGSQLVGETVNTGMKLTTVEDAIVLEFATADKEYNVIEITVKLPESSPVSEKTYTINIKRLNAQISPNYGNTPYGRIMSNDSLDEAGKETAKAAFDADYTYRGASFVSDAWNPYGEGGIEVVKGSVLGTNEYINYDKDDTAIVVYSGDSFTDPGVTLYDSDGEAIALSDSNSVTRTINYETVSSLKAENWGSTQSKTHTSALTGDDSEYVVDVLENEEVKPGIYTINYSYTTSGVTVAADRNMIVLPKMGDLNMDNYVNALDLLVYDKTITTDSVTNCMYTYRALDVNNDGAVTDADKTYLKNRNTITELYPSYSVEKALNQSTYTPPADADNTKAQMYMDFLGTDSTDISAAADASQTLEKSDVFWVGYRFANTANLTSGDLKSITLTVNYDSRYISPDVDNLEALMENNPQLAAFDIEGVSSVAGAYSVDNSTAQYTWQDIPSVRSLVLEMYLKDGQSFALSDDYFIKLPFSADVLPPSDGRNVISTQLGANTFNMAVGESGYGLMWDTSDSLNSVTENLMSKLEYMGDYVPVLAEEAPAALLRTYTYGDSVNIFKSVFNKGTLEGELPEGVEYIAATNTITGAARESGTFDFYIDGVKYRIVIEKAELKVTADDKTKTYGDANPQLTFTYDESCLKNGDTIASAVQTEPTVSCAATVNSAYLSETPITLSGGESANYYFTFTDGKLTVDKQKEINITAISKIPVCTAYMAQNETFPYTITATAANDASEFTSSEILSGDKVQISYGVTYSDNTVGTGKTVTISNVSIVTDAEGYENGGNYVLKSCITSSNSGIVENKSIKTIRIPESCTLEYTYGTPLDLNTGKIRVTYDNDETVNMTFKEAQDLGISIRYTSTQKPANHGDELTVKEHHGDTLTVDYPADADVRALTTSKLTINKKDLHVTADDKSRYYGDENSTVNFTYSFTDSDFVYSDSKDNLSGFVAPTFSCDAKASTEIDKTLGYSEAEIVLTGGSSDNYNIICANGTLRIDKRPLNITAITAGVPALTAKDYTGKTAPFNVDASAVAGDGETASMTVTNLYNNDAVKINYKAQYASSTPADSVSVAVADPVMDDTYGKSYNYTVGNAVTSADGGRVYVKNITALELTEQPTLDYVYGTPLNLETGKIKITYDSGEVNEVTFEEAKAHPVKLTYTDTTTEPQHEEHLTVADTGRKITITPDTIYDVDAVTTGEITIEKHELHVSPDAIYTTYGDVIPVYSYTYRDGDFQYGETEDTAVSVKPVIVCKEDDGTTEVNQKTLSGVYTMKISGGEADNYEFVYTNANCTIRQRPIIITTINDIPELSAKDAFEKNLSFDMTVETDKDTSTLVFEEGGELLWQDKVRITYTVTYPDTTEEGEKDVTISNAVLDRTYGDYRNYYLHRVDTPQKGEVIKAIITDIEITSDPTENAEGTAYEYSYGDDLDLSNGKFKITFDSGRVDEDVTFDKLSEYGITATYTGTEDTVTDGVFVTINYHNNKTITLTPPSDATAAAVETGNIVVNKRKMHVIVNDSTSVYGDEPSYTLSYNEADLAEGETVLTAFTAPFLAPVLSCEIDGGEAGVTTAAGVYTGAIKATGGSTANYEFVCDDTGTLTINKRPLKIHSINSGVPDLTAAIAYENNYTLPIKITGTADNTSLSLENVVNNDVIEITYKAVYNNLEQSESETVAIEDVQFDSNCAVKDNYDISQWPTEATGRILTRLMSKITVNSDPTKMEYTYGQWFALKGGSVDIEYNSGYVERNVTFDKLKDFGINITFVTEDEQGQEIIGDEVKNNTLLTVPLHNGARIKLTPSETEQTTDDIAPAYSGEIIVHKRQMKVTADDMSMTYGDNAPVYTYTYNSGNLVNGDSTTSDRFIDGLTAPTLSCVVDSTTPVGEYEITVTGGASANYEFVPVNGTLTIGKKELKIKSIDTNIPPLTSEAIYKNGGNTPISVAGTALYTDMTLEGIINNDEIGITYNAVYNSTVAGEGATVDITDIAFDSEHDKNNCYTIVEVPSTATNGTILEEQITRVTITEDPVLEYTYGDKLSLDSGAVKVEYDSGRVQENLKFNEIETETNGKVKLVYADGNDETTDAAADNDVLYVSYHDGKSIKLKVTSEAEVTEVQTALITVNKAVITVTAKDKERYYGDSNPSLEFKYSGFVNGDDENSDNFRLDFVSPEISCDAAAESPVGEYDIVLSGGSSANYSFDLVNAILTVNKRQLDITAITGGIPALTSKIIYNDPQLVHKLSGIAINTAGQMAVENLYGNDTVKVTYTVTYTSNEPATDILVSVSNIALDESYGESGNYVLGNVPTTARGGRIYAKQISMVEITKQPKLEYTYGEALDLSAKGVRITYDSGEVITNVAFNELADYNIEVTLTDANDVTAPAVHGDKLTVNTHTGAYLTLTPTTTLNNIDTAVTKTITVNKKPLDVNVKSIASVYGEDPTGKFAFTYDEEDLEYGETLDSPEFKDNLTEPVFVCKEKDGSTSVGPTTNVGSYKITMQDGSSDNYRFVYHEGTVAINRRPLKVKGITGGVPALTSDIIFNTEEAPYKIDAVAEYNQLVLENVVNNDEIRIKYKAVYNSETPVDNCMVDIEYVDVDIEYGDSANYEIDTENSIKSVDGGAIYDREITAMEIIGQPKTEYTYGDKLDLSGGNVTITYDSGYTEENVTFDKLSDYGITVSYTDENGSMRAAADGDILNVPEHDGKMLVLTAKSTHQVEVVKTDKITVMKRVLEYGECVVDAVTYDGITTATTGTVVFTNPQNGDKVTATAIFAFEDFNAGEEKTVYVTDIALDDAFTANYELPSDNVTAKGTIEKAAETVVITADAVAISDTTNSITVTAPDMTQVQIDGGAEYEYSIDGGNTWQKENVFENLPLGLDCKVCVRFAETDNYKQSEMAAVDVQTYLNKLTLISQTDDAVLRSFYTNTTTVNTEAEFKALIGDVGVTYYQCYTDEAGKVKVKYPLELTGDIIIYTSLKKQSSGGGGGGVSYTPKPVPTKTPVTTPSPEPTEEPVETVSPVINEPYISGYEGMVWPDEHMTRAEAATIMVIVSGDTGLEYENVFPDVSSELWYERFISQGNARGLISGFDDGYFRPEDTVTREQFASMVVRLIGIESSDGKSSFVDVSSDRWSIGYINAVSEAGIVAGYEDGTFRPENPITRAEAVRMINAATDRIPDKEVIDELECPYTDLPKTHWAYYEMMLASCEF